jgi:hypothetical protein
MINKSFLLIQIGLKYMTDRFEGNCSISTIDPNGVDATTDGKTVKIRDPEAFFDFDSIDFQYTGQAWFFVSNFCFNYKFD